MHIIPKHTLHEVPTMETWERGYLDGVLISKSFPSTLEQMDVVIYKLVLASISSNKIATPLSIPSPLHH